MRVFLFVVVFAFLGTTTEGRDALNVVRFEKKLEKEAGKVARLFNIFSPRKVEGLKPVEILKHWVSLCLPFCYRRAVPTELGIVQVYPFQMGLSC